MPKSSFLLKNRLTFKKDSPDNKKAKINKKEHEVTNNLRVTTINKKTTKENMNNKDEEVKKSKQRSNTPSKEKKSTLKEEDPKSPKKQETIKKKKKKALKEDKEPKIEKKTKKELKQEDNREDEKVIVESIVNEDFTTKRSKTKFTKKNNFVRLNLNKGWQEKKFHRVKNLRRVKETDYKINIKYKKNSLKEVTNI